MKTLCTEIRRTPYGVGSYVKSIAPTVGLSLAATAAMALPEYGDVWRPPSGCNKYYSSGNGHHFCVIHDMEGYYYTAISYLDRCDISASIYYGVNGLTDSSDQGAPPGQITQCVLEQYYAWHVGCWNTWMFGTEHEGFASNPAWFTEAMYQASSGLQRHLCDNYGIPKDRNHIIAHGQKLVAGWCTWLGANYPSINCTCNSHTDPGPYWDWNHFMALIIGQVNNAAVAGSSVPGSVTAGHTFTATITMNNNGSKPWASGGSTAHSLGSQSPQDNSTWGFGRVALPFSPVNAGQSATFTLNATAPTTAGSYTFAWRMVQDGVEWFGATFSTTITVVPAGPTINTQPASQTVNPGTTVHFTVAATGSGTLTYQWRKDGANLSNSGKFTGVTTATLNISNVQQGEVGNYSVAVTDSRGTVTSAGAALGVNAVQAFYEDFESADPLSAWGVFPSPGTALTISTAQSVSASHSAHVAVSSDRMYRSLGVRVDGRLRITAHVYDGTQTRSFVDVRGYDSGTFQVGTLIQLFCAGKYNGVGLPGETYDGTKYQGRICLDAYPAQFLWFNLNGSGAPSRSTGWHEFIIERHADGTTVDFYVDGVLSRTMTGATRGSLDTAAIGSTASGTTAGESWIDDVRVEYFDQPGITTQPASQTLAAGGTATFSVVTFNTVTGYQWQKNGSNIPGANSSALTLNNVQGSDAANYNVLVMNGAGSIVSSSAALSVSPTITTQPANSSPLPLGTATFTVAASGQTPFSYHWRKNGANLTDSGNIFGTLSPTLTVNSVTPDDVGSYSVVVVNAAGSATSADALLVPVLLPTITTSPVGQTVVAGATVTFTTSATGTPPLSYQWNLNGTDISGATGTSYTRSNVQPGDAGTYAVVISNAAGGEASDGAVLIVNVPPTITTQPAAQAVAAGSAVTFTVIANGTAPLSYQWKRNGTDIQDATGDSYTRPNVQSGDAGTYSVAVSNAAGAVASDGAALTVNTAPTLSSIADQTIVAGQTVSFTAQASDIDTSQALAFSLDAGAPATATIDGTSGAFSWATTTADAGTTTHITVRVTDNGTPSLNDSKTFAAIVVSPDITASLSLSGQDLTIGWNSVSGLTYRVEYKDDWSAPTWSILPPESILATGSAASMSDSLTNGQRFYRIRLLP